MRLSRLRNVSAAVIPLVVLAACSSAPAAPPPSALDVVTVAGTAKAPTLAFKTKPLTVKATTTKVVTAGKGAPLSKANPATFNFAMYNGKDGKQIASSFGKKAQGVDLASANLMPGLSKGMTGQKIGSRLLVAVPPADAFGAQGNKQAGVGPADSVVFLIDVISAVTPLPTATGTAVRPKAGLPTATVAGAKAAKITVPKTSAPKKLVVQPLIKGAGPVVQAGQSIKVSYTGVLWKNGKKFDASADHGGSFSTPIGVGAVVPGWDKGLVGKTVGSRLLLVVPPADGYGTKGNASVGGKDTMVFVIDILAAF